MSYRFGKNFQFISDASIDVDAAEQYRIRQKLNKKIQYKSA